MAEPTIQSIIESIYDRLNHMDESRDKARESYIVRMTKLEEQAKRRDEILDRIESKVDQQSLWLNGNGDPSHGLISMTQVTYDSLLEHLKECKAQDIVGWQTKVAMLESYNRDKDEKAKAAKKEAYSLLKPTLSKALEFLLKALFIIGGFAVFGEPLVKPLLLRWIGGN